MKKLVIMLALVICLCPFLSAELKDSVQAPIERAKQELLAKVNQAKAAVESTTFDIVKDGYVSSEEMEKLDKVLSLYNTIRKKGLELKDNYKILDDSLVDSKIAYLSYAVDNYYSPPIRNRENGNRVRVALADITGRDVSVNSDFDGMILSILFLFGVFVGLLVFLLKKREKIFYVTATILICLIIIGMLLVL